VAGTGRGILSAGWCAAPPAAIRASSRASHTGWWEATPFRAQLQELVTMVLESFPWTLAPIA
jgi:hypothetical protein